MRDRRQRAAGRLRGCAHGSFPCQAPRPSPPEARNGVRLDGNGEVRQSRSMAVGFRAGSRHGPGASPDQRLHRRHGRRRDHEPPGIQAAARGLEAANLYLEATGLDQNSGGCSPQPPSHQPALLARVRYDDGSVGVWTPLAGGDLLRAYWDRWRKWLENVVQDLVVKPCAERRRPTSRARRDEQGRSRRRSRWSRRRRTSAHPEPRPGHRVLEALSPAVDVRAPCRRRGTSAVTRPPTPGAIPGFSPRRPRRWLLVRIAFGVVALCWTLTLAGDAPDFLSDSGILATSSRAEMGMPPGGCSSNDGNAAVWALLAALSLACVSLIIGQFTRLAALVVFVGICPAMAQRPCCTSVLASAPDAVGAVLPPLRSARLYTQSRPLLFFFFFLISWG